MSRLLVIVLVFMVLEKLAAQPILESWPFTSTSLANMIQITHANDDRIFVATSDGKIFIFNPRGQISIEPFLDISNKWSSEAPGYLASIAFHPEFRRDNRIFVHYTTNDGSTFLSSFRTDSERPSVIDSDSEQILLIFSKAGEVFNGGALSFGPDGMLYWATGDVCLEVDSLSFSQDPFSFLGKILRIDVDTDQGYRVPKDNPMYGEFGTLQEIWASGLYQPIGLAFDKEHYELWITDKGKYGHHEVNIISLDAEGEVVNFGWPCKEGLNQNTDLLDCPEDLKWVDPLVTIGRPEGKESNIVAGIIYQSDLYPYLRNHYLFADKLNSRFFLSRMEDSGWRTYEWNSTLVEAPSVIGQDAMGNILVGSSADDRIYFIRDYCQSFQPSLRRKSDGLLVVRMERAFWEPDFYIDWIRDGKVIHSGRDSLFSADISGNYRVELHHERGCIMTSNDLEVQIFAPSLPWETSIQLWPNPFNTSFTLENTLELELDAIIMDQDGKRVDAQVIAPNSRITWHTKFPRGNYTIQFIAANGAQHSRQIIRN
jgi:glucose/arabinose dehydrogenase